MRQTIMVAVWAVGLVACSGSRGLRKDAGATGDTAALAAEVGAPDSAAWDGADRTDTAGADVAAPVDAPAALSDGASPGLAPDSAGSDGGSGADGVVLWPGPDAEIVLGPPVAQPDGGLFPPVFAVPATVIVSHSPLVAAEPDITARIEQVGEPLLVELNGDGLLDLVISDGRNLFCYLQEKSGTFRAIHGVAMPSDTMFDMVKFGDMNQDGLVDLVLVRYPDEKGWYHPELSVYLQTIEGFSDDPAQVAAIVPAAPCSRTYDVFLDDVSGDGRPDIIALSAVDDGSYVRCAYARGIAQIFTQASDGSFSVESQLSLRSAAATGLIWAVSVTTGDLDSDGRKDLVVLQDPAGNGSGIPLHGHEVLVYPQGTEGFAATPTQVLNMGQYLRTVDLADVNDDGRLDILARPGEWSKNEGRIDISDTITGLSGVFLQSADGSFDAARALVLDDPPTDGMAGSARAPSFNTWVWLPAGTDKKFDPLGIAVRDSDGDLARDLVVEWKSVPEGIFRQEMGLFATTPDIEVQSLFPALVAAAKQPVAISFQPNSSSMGTTCNNRLAYRVADMDGDHRDDVAVAYSPCAPNWPADPATGKYPYEGFKPNTYTLIQVHRQRAPERHFAIEVQEAAVAPTDRALKIRATIRNLSEQPASNLRVRIQAAESPPMFNYTLDMLLSRFDEMAAQARSWVTKSENRIKGTPLGPDILIPQIGPRETIPLSISIPVAWVRDLESYALFVVVDPDENTNLLYRRSFDFIH